ncbi:hypothetical protein [Beijerinckia mobilis]|uniref:hypothetical protein n=1 Tax=Beijerinckia mobilis TaxID=231434 RepID=UPI000557887D|nr:hypothetical protein [Beijerinckia mobilis]
MRNEVVIPKSSRSEFRIRKVFDDGAEKIEMRLYCKNGKREFVPTGSGLKFSAEMVPKIIQAIEAAAASGAGNLDVTAADDGHSGIRPVRQMSS